MMLGCSNSDNHFDFDILCIATLKSDYSEKNMNCNFYLFPIGEYTRVIPVTGDIRDGVYGKAIAYKKDGSSVENMGYAYYGKSDKTFASAVSLKDNKPIREGTFYIACVPYSDNPNIFKGKIITKTLDKGLIVDPHFSFQTLTGDKTGYLEWDE